MKRLDDLNIVYSTDRGRIEPVSSSSSSSSAAPRGDGVVCVGRQTKGRKGKGVTVVSGVPLHPEGIRALAAELKRKCGCGGTVKDGVIEIQGEHRDLLIEELQRMGYVAKRAGG